MATIITRAGKGSPLTHNEVDANFTNLNTDKLEASDLTAGTGISITGTTVTNAAPDQTVSITGSGIVSVSGTYPNFEVAATALQAADIGVSVQAYDANLTSFVSAFTLPTVDGTSGQALATNGAGTLSFVDVAGDPTVGSLTKSFGLGETATIILSSSISPTPVVAVTKEIPQTGVSSKGGWDVSATASNYELYNEAPATSLSLSSTTADGTATLGTGSFSASDVGKRIFVDDGGEAILTATDGSFSLVSEFGASTYTSGNWSLSGLDVDATNGITLSGLVADAWDISTSSFVQSFSVATQDTSPTDVFFKSDGLKMYVLGDAGDDVNEYNLSTAWDVSTASFLQTFSVSAQETSANGLFFKPDGAKMYIIGFSGDDVNEYNLSTAWDVSTATFLQSFSVAAQMNVPGSVFFKPDGFKMYVVEVTNQRVFEYNLSTAWNVSTASYVQFFSAAVQPYDVFFREDGLKMYVAGQVGDDAVYEYNLSTAWDISTATLLQSFSVAAQETNFIGIFFKPDGLKMYVVGATGDDVNEYDVGLLAQPTAQYLPALTSTEGQIDSQYWTDINGMTADDVDNDGQVYYAVSTDDRITWKIAKASDGERPIVRNNGGTWEYNSNATYGSVTWTSATINNEFAAIAEALGATAVNQMDKAQLDAVTDAAHFTLGDTLDLAIVPYLASAGTAPTSDAAAINYDAAVLNKGAILGTDYDYDFPEANKVRITSLAAQNLKVRIF